MYEEKVQVSTNETEKGVLGTSALTRTWPTELPSASWELDPQSCLVPPESLTHRAAQCVPRAQTTELPSAFQELDPQSCPVCFESWPTNLPRKYRGDG
jgi:hypothetical protein